MFRNKLTYYHGTTVQLWEKIQADKVFRPNAKKSVGQYWITKGAYFVCENPFIALWYAHLTCCLAKDSNAAPILISFRYAADPRRKGDVINLLSSDGLRLLSYAHRRFRATIPLKEIDDSSFNLDSKVLELLLANSESARGILASFQEGKSFQSILHNGNYSNPNVLAQKGICPGDHAEICFYPHLSFSDIENIQTVDIDTLTKNDSKFAPLWPLVCQSLNGVLTREPLRKKLNRHLKNRYPMIALGGAE